VQVSSKTFRDRIVELRRVPARELIPNPRNWRRHPARQATPAPRASEEVGYVFGDPREFDLKTRSIAVPSALDLELPWTPDERAPTEYSDLHCACITDSENADPSPACAKILQRASPAL
jgi:hypothetical protein